MKERTRFDALAEELTESKPEPKKKELKPSAPVVLAVRDPSRAGPKRDAYISSMGMMYPVMSFEMSTTLYGEREYDFMAASRRQSHRVKCMLAGILRETRPLLQDQDAVLVVLTAGEPQYLRLQITDVRTTMNGNGSNYTEIEANAMETNW